MFRLNFVNIGLMIKEMKWRVTTQRKKSDLKNPGVFKQIKDGVRSVLISIVLYKEWVKVKHNYIYYYYVAIWWKVANNYMFRP